MSRGRRLALAGLILVLVAAISAWAARRSLGEAIYHRAIEQTAGIDTTGSLPDGLHVFACGTGSPLPDAARAGPCLAVLAGRQGYVFDAGSGSVRKLQRMGFPMPRLRGAFLTHLHSDHIDGLGELMLQAWIAGHRAEPLPIHGPAATGEVVSGLVQAYAPDRAFRIAHHGPAVARPGGFGAIALPVSGPDGSAVVQDGAVTIKALRVDHAPVDEAYAYRIDYAGRSVVISGDTSKSATLAKFARGTDVLFHEALNREFVGTIGKTLAQRGDRDDAKIMADIPDYHTSPVEAAEVAKAAGAQRLYLYHLVPAPPSRLLEAAFVGDAMGVFLATEVARDGLLVSLPKRSTAIEEKQAL